MLVLKGDSSLNSHKLVLASHVPRHAVSVRAALEYALTAPWPHEGSVLHAACGVRSVVSERHDTLCRLLYASCELWCITCSVRMNASDAATLEYTESRCRLTRHGDLVDGNDVPQQRRERHVLRLLMPRTAKHCYRKGTFCPWSHT